VPRLDSASRSARAHLCAVPPSEVGRHQVGAAPVSEETAKSYTDLADGMVTTLADRHDPTILQLDEDAQAAIQELETDIEAELADGGAIDGLAEEQNTSGRSPASSGYSTWPSIQYNPANSADWRHDQGRSADRFLLQGAHDHGVRRDEARPVDLVPRLLARSGKEAGSTRELLSKVTRTRFENRRLGHAYRHPCRPCASRCHPNIQAERSSRPRSPRRAAHPAAISAESAKPGTPGSALKSIELRTRLLGLDRVASTEEPVLSAYRPGIGNRKGNGDRSNHPGNPDASRLCAPLAQP
jgi:hypothetical protein